ncbi:MAG TPA: gluconate 2-dehydrogenase subunit 3 family protein [Candidatus Limnocylindrales bacterium]|nr:gluconate 2-dehydrogenase subunit 3 family protein [Candidatus Limnocylindrales bacterium]
MKPFQAARRDFLLQAGGAAGAAWVSAQWPAILSAAQHAHETAKSDAPPKFEVLTPEQAKDVEAIASQFIPTDELPGARETGVVYFIDRALKTFASEAVPVYQKGLAELKQLTSETFPGVKSFADASAKQQEKLTAELAEELNPEGSRPGRRMQLASGGFVRTIWQHTILGFLADPEAGGNRDYAGWKVIGRDPAHSFSPPFGYYDKDYPGWQPTSPESEKK